MLLSELKETIGVRCVRDGEFDSVALLGLRRNEEEKHIAYILGEAYLDVAKNENIDCLIIPEAIVDFVCDNYEGGICVAEDPKTAMFAIHEDISRNKDYDKTMIAKSAMVAKTASIAERGVVIGENTRIEDCVVIQEGTVIGDNCTIMAGTVIGTPAFYYYGDNDNKKMVFSSGGVEIEDHVVIHSNVSICKGVIGGMTRVGKNTCLDSNTFLGHDVHIGENVIVAASSSFGGWVEIGADCFFGVNSNVAPMVKVGSGVKGSIGCVITKDVENDVQMSGNFAIEHGKFIDNLKNSL